LTVIVFAGPTIPAAEITGVVDCTVLPPVSMGDIYRASRRDPRAIGIIDGYFDGVPSVWHKEILWAMERGIAVFGAASMGALRAAELHTFGMRGVGRIFEAFRNGLLEDDDEVAVQHGPADLGYLPLSEPMVNFRATLDRAVAEGAIQPEIAAQLSAKAKASFYPERRWRNVLERGQADGIDKQVLAALEAWLPTGRVDQKRLDALAMLEAMRDLAMPPIGAAGYRLEQTTMWADAVREIESTPADRDEGLAIIEELRHDPEQFRSIRRNAATKFAISQAAATRPVTTGANQAATRFRTQRGLFTQSALDLWLKENDLDKPGFEQMLGEGDRLEEMETTSDLSRHMLNELRLTGAYAALSARARRKRDRLKSLGLSDTGPLRTGLSALELRRWFFETRLGRRMPADISSFLYEAGYPDRDMFDLAITREYMYCSHGNAEVKTEPS
jgi:hypothetical protein